MSKKQGIRRRKTQLFRTIATVCCLTLLLVAGGILGHRVYQTQKHKQLEQTLQNLYASSTVALAEEASETTETTPAPAPAPAPAQQPETAGGESTEIPADSEGTAGDTEPVAAAPAPAEATPTNTNADTESMQERTVQPDFAGLYAVNPHLAGWLTAGENIALPIVYYDNTFYLDHDFYGNKDSSGTVFINEGNTLWPPDTNLLFHGHNMRNGSSFGTLDTYRDNLEYYKKHPIVTFRTIYDAEPTNYIIIAGFDMALTPGAKDYYEIGYNVFDTDKAFFDYVSGAMKMSDVKVPVDVQPTDHLITLITCSNYADNGRFIVMARALRDGETVDQMTQLMQSATLQ